MAAFFAFDHIVWAGSAGLITDKARTPRSRPWLPAPASGRGSQAGSSGRGETGRSHGLGGLRGRAEAAGTETGEEPTPACRPDWSARRRCPSTAGCWARCCSWCKRRAAAAGHGAPGAAVFSRAFSRRRSGRAAARAEGARGRS